MVKDDLIAELQLQLDEVVVEGQSFHDQMELYRAKAEQLEEEVRKFCCYQIGGICCGLQMFGVENYSLQYK